MDRFNRIMVGEPHLEEPEDANGPVREYRLSPEEIAAKYGPPAKRSGQRRPKLSRELLAKELKIRTVGQLAERFKVPQEMVFKLAERYGLELDKKNRLKEECAVENIDTSLHKQGFKPYEPKKSRLELARERFTADKYQELKDQGKTDKEIMAELDIPNDVFYKLKKELGLIKNVIQDQVEKNRKREQARPAAAEKKISVYQAVKLLDELSDEMACAEDILKPDANLAPRVKELLKKHFEECSAEHERIQKALDSVEIEV